MAVVGSAEQWADVFPEGLISPIIEAVLSAWRRFPKPDATDHEVPITRRFRQALRHERDLRRLPFRVERESVEDDPDTAEELGRIDLRLLYGVREEVYFAFECKRLRVPSNGSTRSLAWEYVVEGMLRFVDGRYGAHSAHGGMMGYVMDGNVPLAMKGVGASIKTEKKKLRQRGRKGLNRSSLFPRKPAVRETSHDRGSSAIRVHHLFLRV